MVDDPFPWSVQASELGAAAPATAEKKLRAKVGDHVLIDADFTDVKTGVVSAADASGFQIEGRNLWFGWHEFAGLSAR